MSEVVLISPALAHGSMWLEKEDERVWDEEILIPG